MQVVPTTGRAELTPFEDAVDRLELAVAAPVVIQRLLATIADPRSSVRDVEAVLTVDPSLVMRVLKLASSAVYARRPVRDLGGAIRTVGLHELRRLAVTAHFATGRSPLARELWAYSLAVAFACERLALIGRPPPGPDLFLCGLLHDIGTLVLDRLLGERYARLAIVPGDGRQADLERAAFGFDHTDLGAMAVARWNLFPELEPVVQLHHDPFAADRLGLPAASQAAIELVALARLGFLTTSEVLTDGEPAEVDLAVALAGRRGVTMDQVCDCAEEGRAQAAAVLGALTAA